LEQLSCPVNDRLCSEEAVWFTQTTLLNDKNDMEKIAGAIRKISREAKAISKL
nr:DegT/DnrJ/EryC1/StrS family aminotransferase [Proteiniphilum sp.]